MLVTRNFGVCLYHHLWRFRGLSSTVNKLEVMNSCNLFIRSCVLFELLRFFKKRCFQFLLFLRSINIVTRLMTICRFWKLFLNMIWRVLCLILLISWSSHVTRLLLRVIGHLVLRHVVRFRLYELVITSILLHHLFWSASGFPFNTRPLLLFNDCDFRLGSLLWPSSVDLFW